MHMYQTDMEYTKLVHAENSIRSQLFEKQAWED